MMENAVPQTEVRPSGVDIDELVELAAAGLVPMFNAHEGLFCCRVKRTSRGLEQEGVSRRYTMISLLGLHRLEAAGFSCPLAVRPVLNGLLRDLGPVSSLGDLGLLLWLCASAAPDRLPEVVSKVDVKRDLRRFEEVRSQRTMELAWFLTGLANASLALPRSAPDLENLALAIYRLLRKNQGPYGAFGHLAPDKSLAGRFRGRIGSFADQVYPIYALTRFATAYGIEPPLAMALRCAKAVCKLQGPQGQWWWQYDSRSGTIFQRYPVFSVHQDGMGPMALLELGEAVGTDFSGPVYKGLQWVGGDNELACEMRDMRLRVIWRSVENGSRHWNRLRSVGRLLGATRSVDSADGLRINFECRPYHLGWLLYAFAGRSAAVRAAHSLQSLVM